MTAATQMTWKLFDSLDGECGILSALVLEEHCKKEDPDYNLDNVKRRFVRAECPNAAFVVDWAERNATVEHFGFGTIYESDLGATPEGEGDRELGQLFFGDPEHGISPISWLVYLSMRIHELPFWDRLRFDTVCSEIMLMYEQVPEITN